MRLNTQLNNFHPYNNSNNNNLFALLLEQGILAFVKVELHERNKFKADVQHRDLFIFLKSVLSVSDLWRDHPTV